MKECGKCNEHKEETEYCKDNGAMDGLFYWCKVCSAKHRKEYSRTINGYVSVTYNNQRRSSEKRKHPYPDYTQQEFKKWLLDQDLFHKLFKDWEDSEYLIGLKPSADRIDDYKYYTFDNLQLMTWKENDVKAHEDMKNGVNMKNKQTPVAQCTLDGTIIATFYSQQEASRRLGIRQSYISRVCTGERRQALGYKWKYI